MPPSFSSFSQALDEVKNARVFCGHSLRIRMRRRSSDRNWVLDHALLRAQ